MEKWPFFDQNHGLTPLEKSQFFDFLNFFFFWFRKAFFRFRILQNTFSWPILPKKKRDRKRLFLDQNHGLTPLEKSQFFDFLNFVFLWARKAFFRSRIYKHTFSWPITPKKKRWKNGHFLTKTLWKNLNFSTF